MLSSKFLVVSFLYLFYTANLVVADPLGGGQFCESVRTVTVLRTVTPNQPPPSSSPAKNANPPPAATQKPGNVNLGNNGKNGNTKTSSSLNTKSSSVKPKPSSVNPKPTSVTNKNGNTKPSSVSNKDNNTKNGNTKTSSVNPQPTSANPKPSSVNPKNNDTKTSSTALPSATPPAKTNLDDNNQDNDPSTSPTLNPFVIQNITGKAQGDGQVDSLVSRNNFINVCVGKTLTNGKQVQAGSCNPIPMGDIPSIDNMPTAKFTSPKNFDTIPANTAFTISIKINNLVTGTFTNAANTYYAAPQQLVNGVIKGHSHVTVQPMTSLDSTDPLNPRVFAFFKGLNEAGNNGVLSTTVANGLPAGVYRISSINAAANHQEVVGPVAQHGSFNDAIYITVTNGGQDSNPVPPTSVSSGVPSSSLSSPAVSPTSSVPPDVSSTAPPPLPTGTDGNDGDGKNGDGKNDDGKNDGASSSEPPVPTSEGGKNGDKEGDPTPSSPLSTTPTPTAGNDKTDKEDPAVPSSAAPPDSTPKGDKDPQGGNSKRMHKRSHLA